MGTASDAPTTAWPPPDPRTRRWLTPTGECCLRAQRVDGTVAGTGDCVACGTCLLLLEHAWGGGPEGDGPQ